MIIATFTSGDRTIIGCGKEGQENSIRTIDSRLLYENPDKFVGRFCAVLLELFGISNLLEDDVLTFAINGVVDTETKTIKESSILNGISSRQTFNNYNFDEAFKDLVEKNNIYLMTDSDFVAWGVRFTYEIDTQYPAISIYVDKNVGVSIIKENDVIGYSNVLRPIAELENQSANYLLCDEGIDDLLYSGEENIFKSYSQSLITIIEDIIERGKVDGFYFKRFFIHLSRVEFVKKELVQNGIDGVEIIFSEESNKDALLTWALQWRTDVRAMREDEINVKSKDPKLPMVALGAEILGTLASPILGPLGTVVASLVVPIALMRRLKTKIIKIEYNAMSGSGYKSFDKFEDFAEHWKATKPIALGENYYKIIYQDETNMRVYLDSLNSTTDLQRYKF